MENEINYTIKETSPIMIALAWTVVAIPLLYGIHYTALKAAALFQ